MIILSIDLYRYKNFRFSNIEELVLDTSQEPVQIFIGSNGSGKSSLLRECVPFPSVRTNFDKKGKKSITLEHEGSKYILTSDFSNHHSPHSFIKDSDELNISGTTKIQHELIEEHLGITPEKHQILTVGYDIARMTTANRKTLLLNLNPTNMALILDKYKKVCSQIRSCKNQLSLLYKRKSEISEQMIEPNLFKEMQTNKAILEEKKNTLHMWLYALKSHVDQLEIPEMATVNLDVISRHVKETNIKSSQYHFIDRDTYQADMATIKETLDRNCNYRDQLIVDIENTLKEIEEYEKHLANSSDDTTKDSLVSKMKELGSIRDSLSVNIETFNPFSQYEMDKVMDMAGELSKIMNFFVDYGMAVPHPSTFPKIESKLNELQNILIGLSSKLGPLNSALESAEKQLFASQVSIPSDCTFNNCDLKNNFVKNRENLESEIRKLKSESTKLSNQFERIRKAKHKLGDYYDSIKPLIANYTKLKSIINEVPCLNVIFKKVSLADINRQPLRILESIKDYIQMSVDFHRKKSAIDELALLEKQLLEFGDSDTKSKQFLEKIVREKTQLLKSKKETLSDLDGRIAAISSKYNVYLDYTETRNSIASIQNSVDSLAEAVEIKASVEYYQKLISVLSTILVETDDVLRDVSTKLKEQEGLRDRLEKEIVSLINQVEAEKSKYEILEKALSPASGIPHRYMVNFLNSIIKNMNIFINKVWTYPLELELLDPDKPIDYSFSIKVGDLVVNDISTCSDGQKTIINLAFALAMIVQLKLNNYPLFVDEIDRDLDSTHKQELISLFHYLIEHKLITGMFLVNHHNFDSGLRADVTCLNDENVLVPSVYNENVKIKNY